MTANQINYTKYLEDVRSHRASEAINREQAKAATSQAETAAYNAETNRMNAGANLLNAETNQSAVGAQWYGAQANAAYQTAMATVSQAQQREAARHNRANESNDLLVSLRSTNYNYYKTQTERDTAAANRASNERNVDVQTRGALINTLIGAGAKGVEALLKTGVGALIKGGLS